MTTTPDTATKPTPAFIGASWVALVLGMGAYFIGLFNSHMELNEKGYYFAVFVFGLFAAVSLQKTVRDRADGIPVTNIYYGLSWFAVICALSLLAIGLWNAGSLILSEKGFYGMAFAMSLFVSVAVQKNIRDLAQFKGDAEDETEDADHQHRAFRGFTQQPPVTGDPATQTPYAAPTGERPAPRD